LKISFVLLVTEQLPFFMPKVFVTRFSGSQFGPIDVDFQATALQGAWQRAMLAGRAVTALTMLSLARGIPEAL
jgi:hypothetical protein